MKWFNILLILLFIYVNINAQETDSQKRFTRAVTIGYQYAGLPLEEQGDFQSQHPISEFTEDGYGATIGWRIQQMLTKSWYAQSGVNINYAASYLHRVEGLVSDSHINTNTGEVISTFSSIEENFSILDIEIPLYVGFNITENFYANAGVSGNVVFYAHSDQKTSLGNGIITGGQSNSRQFRRLGANYIFAVGYMHSINDKLAVFIEPQYKARLIPETTTHGTNFIPWYASLNIGLSF